MDRDLNQDAEVRACAELIRIVRELRAKCPWDREQTLASLSKHLIEEAYEAADALADGAPRAIADELGDLVTQGIFAGIIAEQAGQFTLAAMVEAAAQKLIRRHPHVYGEVQAGTAGEVVANWSRIKETERKAAGATSALDGVARALPALMRAEKLGARARDAGMDWGDIHAVLAKVREEMDEVEGALARNDPAGAAAELGDMLLALANAPRLIDHSAEEVLRHACDKFTNRFRHVEQLATSRGLDLNELTPAELEDLWQTAKAVTAKPD
jgi:tetrapyrrole methylase family protein/MazG family protein